MKRQLSAALDQAVPGFEKTSRKIRRAVQVAGRIEFEAPAPRLRSGEPYRVGVYLVNQGRQAVKLKDVSVGLHVDGRKTDGRVPPRTAEVKRGEPALVHEVRGQWPAAASGDTYKSQLSWK